MALPDPSLFDPSEDFDGEQFAMLRMGLALLNPRDVAGVCSEDSFDSIRAAFRVCSRVAPCMTEARLRAVTTVNPGMHNERVEYSMFCDAHWAERLANTGQSLRCPECREDLVPEDEGTKAAPRIVRVEQGVDVRNMFIPDDAEFCKAVVTPRKRRAHYHANCAPRCSCCGYHILGLRDHPARETAIASCTGIVPEDLVCSRCTTLTMTTHDTFAEENARFLEVLPTPRGKRFVRTVARRGSPSVFGKRSYTDSD